MIDWSQMITAEDRAAALAETRAATIRRACGLKIEAAAPRHARENLLAAALAGALTPGEMAAHAALRDWIGAMQAECRRAITGGTEPHWPDPPEEASALVRAY